MKSSEGKVGRVFLLRLEHGDRLPDCIEQFAEKNNIATAHVIFIGGIGKGKLVVGPKSSTKMPPVPVILPIDQAHEVLGVGLLAKGENNNPVLHMHASLGRSRKVLTGCIRPGVSTWLVGEVIIYEILGIKANRKRDDKSGFELLNVNQ